jgi:hypothetical protein
MKNAFIDLDNIGSLAYGRASLVAGMICALGVSFEL